MKLLNDSHKKFMGTLGQNDFQGEYLKNEINE